MSSDDTSAYINEDSTSNTVELSPLNNISLNVFDNISNQTDSLDSISRNKFNSQNELSECNSCIWNTIGLTCFVIVYVLLFKYRNPLQYYVKFATYVTIVMVYATLIIPITLLRPNDPNNINFVAICLSFLLKIFRIKFEVEDAKYLQINQPYILITNHQSSLDFITMMNIWPGNKCTPLAKKELIYSGPFGVAIWLCGITFIDRLNHEKAKGTINTLAERINREHLRIWIYPEGTRSPRTQLLPFKKGAFHLAVQAQIPVVCVVTSSYLNFYSKKEKKFLSNGLVKVKVLPPFQTKGMTANSVNQFTKHLQDKMQKEFDLLNKEINLEEKYWTRDNTTSSLANGDDFGTNDITPVADLDKSIRQLIRENKFLSNGNGSSLIDTNDLSLNHTKDSNMNSQYLNDDNNNSITEEDNKKLN